MKTLTAIFFILFFTSSSFSQGSFSMPVEVTQGFVFQDYHNPQWYSASTSVSPTYNFLDNRLHVSEVNTALFYDGLTYFYAGGGISGTIIKKETYSIDLMGSALMGTRDSDLFSGGVKLTYRDFFITITGGSLSFQPPGQENNERRFHFGGGLGMNLWGE